VSVIHTISDPQSFWSAVEESDIPDGVSVRQVVPNGDGSKAVCLWEADSVDAVKGVVEGSVGDASSNEYFEVDASKAQGLPG
jgi:hypothetical protein